jgi:hypothetical protein
MAILAKMAVLHNGSICDFSARRGILDPELRLTSPGQVW